jgi:hypothetical protein
MYGPADAQQTMSELLRYNLVEYNPHSRRYWLNDLTRVYARAHLDDGAAGDRGSDMLRNRLRC